MKFLKEKFDIAFSIGEACKPTYHLKRLHLYSFTSPLDWMVTKNLSSISLLFKEKFSSFFQSLQEIIPDSAIRKSNYRPHKFILDTKNQILSKHHFPTGINTNKYQNVFLTLMQKRYKRMDFFIKNSNSVLFVSARNEAPKEFVKFLQKIDKLYPNKNFTLVNIRDKTGIIKPKIRIFEENNIKIIDYAIEDKYDDTDPELSWRGNNNVWDLVFSDIHLSAKFAYYRLFLRIHYFIKYRMQNVIYRTCKSAKFRNHAKHFCN